MSRLTELIKHYQQSVDYLTKNWDVTTRHMEMGEIIQHREHCQIEDDTLTFLIELQHYKDLEEQGRLITLPCKVGDTVYVIENKFDDDGTTAYIAEYELIEISYDGRFWTGEFYQFGKEAFTTKEEAEAKLRELNTHDREKNVSKLAELKGTEG